MQNYCPCKTVQHQLSIILFLSTENVSRTNLLTLTHVTKMRVVLKTYFPTRWFASEILRLKRVLKVFNVQLMKTKQNKTKKHASRVATEPSKISADY